MGVRRLTTFVVLTSFIGLGVFFAYLMGLTYAVGGRMLLDMTQFNEEIPEFIAMLVLTATAPYAMYLADKRISTGEWE